MNKNLILYGLGALMLGIVGLTVGDFALQWQPVPEGTVLRTPLAYLSAALLTAAAAALVLQRKHARLGALVLGSMYALWVVVLHLPRVAMHPADLGMWLGFGEILALATAGLIAWKYLSVAALTHSLTRIGQVVFGICLLIFGASHYVYADFSATMIPGWLPAPLFWVYLTGSGHIAAGLSFISGIATRLASTLLVAMIACFVVLLHLPRVLADPANRVEWTMLGVSTSLLGAAWIMRATVMQAQRSHAAVPSAA